LTPHPPAPDGDSPPSGAAGLAGDAAVPAAARKNPNRGATMATPGAPAGRSLQPPPESAAVAIRDYIRRLYNKLAEDNIFFLAGAIAFKVIIAIVPLVLATLGIAGLLLRSRYGDQATEQIIRLVSQALPPLNDPLIRRISDGLDDLFSGATGFIGIGTLLLVWLSTGIVGTLRTALREIFDLQEDRGIIAGKLFDMAMVIAAGTFLAVNVGLTIIFRVVGTYGRSMLGIDPDRFAAFDGIMLNVLAFLSIWFMFVLVYRYLPARRIQWRIALISATFTGVFFEAMKAAFSWYATNVASYTTTYGNFATIIVFFLWIYYTSVVFIVGGEVGQVAALRRIRRRQKERLC
jgi:membrane protein